MIRQGRSSEYGNIFILLFAAVGMVGILGASMSYLLRGPVKTMGDVTRRTVAENSMIASSRLAVLMSPQLVSPPTGDCDADGYVEPVPFRAAGGAPFPNGGGLLPTTIGAALTDAWKTEFGYCVWDHGSAIDDAGCGGAPQLRLRGGADGTYSVLAVISAGPNRAFETNCNDFVDANTDLVPDTPLVDRPAGSDDLVMAYTYNEANNSVAGGVWKLKIADPTTAEIAKDLEVKDSGGTVRVSVDSTTGVGDFYGITTDLITPKTSSTLEVDGSLQAKDFLAKKENDWTTVNLETYSNTHSSTLIGSRARGTIASPTSPLLSDILASFQGRPVGESVWGGMSVLASENHTPTAKGIDLRFTTTNNGTMTVSEKMRISHAGDIGIGTSTPAATLHLKRSNGGAVLTLEGRNTLATDQQAIAFITGGAGSNHLGTAGVTGWTFFGRSETFTGEEGDVGFAYWDGTGFTRALQILKNGYIGIGMINPEHNVDTQSPNGTSTIISARANNAGSQVRAYVYSNSANTPIFSGRRARGTYTAPTFSQANDLLAGFQGASVGVTAPLSGAGMIVRATENHGANTMGSELIWQTVPNGTKLANYQMRLSHDGMLKIGGGAAPAATLDVDRFMMLDRNSSAPVTCNATANGSIALTSDARMCVCNGTAWREVNSATACTW